MFVLNTNLTKDDYEFASNYLKMLLLTRDRKDAKDYERCFAPLAERGQVEAMELYCKNLSPFATLNTKIVSKFKELEIKNKKEPREFMALYAFYNWFADSYKINYKIENVEKLENYQKGQQYYKSALILLKHLSSVDDIASEWIFRIENQDKRDEEYFRTLSNYRNSFYAKAGTQVNESKKMKFLFAYATNTILFASDKEFVVKTPVLTKICNDVQKFFIQPKEMRK